MNTPETSQPAPRRRIRWWWWVLGGFVASALVVAIAAVDTITLSGDARALRQAAFSALDHPPQKQIEISAGWMLLGAARTCIAFIDRVPPEARLALKAVRSASVGVYRPQHDIDQRERTRLFAEADAAMNRHGWTRTVGVIDGHDTVLIYTHEPGWFSRTQHVCIVVCEPRQLVIVSANADPAPLLELAATRHDLAWSR